MQVRPERTKESLWWLMGTFFTVGCLPASLKRTAMFHSCNFFGVYRTAFHSRLVYRCWRSVSKWKWVESHKRHLTVVGRTVRRVRSSDTRSRLVVRMVGRTVRRARSSETHLETGSEDAESMCWSGLFHIWALKFPVADGEKFYWEQSVMADCDTDDHEILLCVDSRRVLCCDLLCFDCLQSM